MAVAVVAGVRATFHKEQNAQLPTVAAGAVDELPTRRDGGLVVEPAVVEP